MNTKARLKPFSAFWKRPLSLAIAFVLALGISLAFEHPSQAQFALPEGFGQDGPVNAPEDVTRYGNIETIEVESPLSINNLFTIASPTVYDRSPEALSDQFPVEQRAREIEDKLLLLLRRATDLNRPLDPGSLVFEVSRLNNVAVVSVRDNKYPRPLILLSVTTLDADFNGMPVDELAEEWRDVLEAEVRSGIEKLPDDQRRVYQLLVVLFILTVTVSSLKFILSKRQKQLRQQKQAISVASASVVEDPQAEGAMESDALESEVATESDNDRLVDRRASLLQGLQRIFSIDRRLAILDFAQWLLFWLLILSWYGGFSWVFIAARYLVDQELFLLRVLLDVLRIWFFTGLTIRIIRRLIDYFTVSREGLDLTDLIALNSDTQRVQLRASTIAGAAKGLATIAIALFGFLSALRALGISTASVVAIGSLAGLAITFGSQSLVKDLVNGFLILVEDQYAIGDVIDLGFAAGLVETLNMRITQIRSASGDLVTVPNSSINQVKNLTRSWSRVAFSIDVAYQTDPDHALIVMQEVAQTLYNDPDWHDKVLDEPTVLGIDSVSHTGMTLTTWIQTEPAQQWAVGREFRLRVRRALAEHGIEIGTPRQTYTLESNLGQSNSQNNNSATNKFLKQQE